MQSIHDVETNIKNKVKGMFTKVIPAAKNIYSVHRDNGREIYSDSFISIHLELLLSISFGEKKYLLYLGNVS